MANITIYVEGGLNIFPQGTAPVDMYCGLEAGERDMDTGVLLVEPNGEPVPMTLQEAFDILNDLGGINTVSPIPVEGLFIGYNAADVIYIGGREYLAGPALIISMPENDFEDISRGREKLAANFLVQNTVGITNGKLTLSAIRL